MKRLCHCFGQMYGLLGQHRLPLNYLFGSSQRGNKSAGYPRMQPLNVLGIHMPIHRRQKTAGHSLPVFNGDGLAARHGCCRTQRIDKKTLNGPDRQRMERLDDIAEDALRSSLRPIHALPPGWFERYWRIKDVCSIPMRVS